MTVLNKKQILEAQDLPTELVEVPEWGGEVYVRGMSGVERDKFEAGIVQQKGKGTTINMENVRAKLASMTVCDETGTRLFTEADLKELSKKSAAALQRIFVVAQRLSGIGTDDLKELTDGLEENPLEGSASDSP